MKKILFYAMALTCVLATTSCKDDNESNPTLTQPTKFVLNTPVVGENNVDLLTTKSIDLTWSQPTSYTDFNAPVIPTYYVQLSTAGTFEKAFDESAEDNSGADYIQMSETYASGHATLLGTDIAKAMQQLNEWSSDAVPALQKISIRIKSVVRDASFTEYFPIFSNVASVNTIPYYVELSNAAPEIWYLTGGCIANGSWNNAPDKIGEGMTPMYIIPAYEYDKKTGKGEIEYAGYFPDEANFKIIAPEGLSNWNYGICGGTEEGGQVYRDGGDDPGNIVVKQGGYYKITLNTASHALTWEKLDGIHAPYTQIAMPGDYQGWDVNSNLMTALTTVTNNHDWVANLTFTSDPSDGGGVKFAANGGWDVNWGGDTFPFGTGTANGANIWYKQGNYQVFFNDILGTYMFIEKQ